jgi:hypothetical protein
LAVAKHLCQFAEAGTMVGGGTLGDRGAGLRAAVELAEGENLGPVLAEVADIDVIIVRSASTQLSMPSVSAVIAWSVRSLSVAMTVTIRSSRPAKWYEISAGLTPARAAIRVRLADP